MKFKACGVRGANTDDKTADSTPTQIPDRLMGQYQGKWVAFHKGRVVSDSDDFVSVMDDTGRKGYPMAYIDRVGQEGMMEFRSRRVTFNYEQSDLPTALPVDERGEMT